MNDFEPGMPLGSPLWILIRLISLVVLGIAAIMMVGAWLERSVFQAFVAFGVAGFAILSQFNNASVRVDADGLLIRRWFRRYLVPWHLVADIRWSWWWPQKVVLVLKRRVGHSRSVDLMLDHSEVPGWFRRRPEPATVQWLRAQLSKYHESA